MRGCDASIREAIDVAIWSIKARAADWIVSLAEGRPKSVARPELIKAQAPATKVEEATVLIAKVLEREPDLTVREIAGRIGHSHGTTYRALKLVSSR